ncbi:MAG TPA: ABC transporter substrate-binding protein [Chloroflexia bacterium]|nr:ABC transporter substrate-binding protein [Chloroflexia bacterium]
MSDIDKDRRLIYTRRGFLKTAVLAAGALVAAPLLSDPKEAGAAALAEKVGAKSPHSGTATRLGVLLPESHLYPELGSNFLAGMRAYLGLGSDNAPGRQVTVIAEKTGFGPQRIVQKAEKLLREDGANLLVGLLTPSVATTLHGMLEANKTYLIAASVGENLPRRSEQHPFTFYHTLATWQSNYALGEWAAGKLGRRAFVATSFYDSGYDSLYAFRLGFERGGGTVTQTYVSGLPGDTSGMNAVVEAMVQAQPDMVYGAFCGERASDFVKAYAHSSLSGRIPLVGSAFLVDESLLSVQGAAALGVTTAFSSPALESHESQAFIAAYRKESTQAPDAFALLGYETAQLVAEALNPVGKNALLGERLKRVNFTGPRGPIAIDPTTHSTAGGPIYLREVQRQGGALRNVTVAELNAVAVKDAQVEALRDSPKTGWLNAYLSV